MDFLDKVLSMVPTKSKAKEKGATVKKTTKQRVAENALKSIARKSAAEVKKGAGKGKKEKVSVWLAKRQAKQKKKKKLVDRLRKHAKKIKSGVVRGLTTTGAASVRKLKTAKETVEEMLEECKKLMEDSETVQRRMQVQRITSLSSVKPAQGKGMAQQRQEALAETLKNTKKLGYAVMDLMEEKLQEKADQYQNGDIPVSQRARMGGQSSGIALDRRPVHGMAQQRQEVLKKTVNTFGEIYTEWIGRELDELLQKRKDISSPYLFDPNKAYLQAYNGAGMNTASQYESLQEWGRTIYQEGDTKPCKVFIGAMTGVREAGAETSLAAIWGGEVGWIINLVSAASDTLIDPLSIVEDANQLLMDPQGTVSQEIDALKEQWNQNAEGKVAVVMDVGLVIVGAFTGKLPAKIKRGDKGAETRSEIKNQDEDKKESNNASGSEQLFSDMDEKVTEGKGVQIKTEVEEEVIHSIVGEGSGAKGVGDIQKNLSERVSDIRAKMPSSKLRSQGNMATADVNIPGIKKEFNAHSQINSSTSKGADIGDFSYLKPESERKFTTYVDAGKPGLEYPRYHDTEAKILEDIASQIDDPYISGSINLYTEAPACQSCTNVIFEFRREFPNIKLNILTKQ